MIRAGDIDVPPLAANDFDSDDEESKYFIADISLFTIIADVTASFSQIPPRNGLPPTASMLATWIAELPTTFALYTQDGLRTPYSFSAADLYLTFYGAIITSHYLCSLQQTRQVPSLRAARISAVQMAMLYEEILCQDDVSLLNSLHSYWCLTAALPLLSYRPQSADSIVEREEKLKSLLSTVDHLRPRFGVTRSIATQIKQLQRAYSDETLLQHIATAEESSPSELGIEDESSQLKALFPHLSFLSDLTASSSQQPLLRDILNTGHGGFQQPNQCDDSVFEFDMADSTGLFDSFFGADFTGDGILFQ
jgi:hypothetical protein